MSTTPRLRLRPSRRRTLPPAVAIRIDGEDHRVRALGALTGPQRAAWARVRLLTLQITRLMRQAADARDLLPEMDVVVVAALRLRLPTLPPGTLAALGDEQRLEAIVAILARD